VELERDFERAKELGLEVVQDNGVELKMEDRIKKRRRKKKRR